MTRHLVFSTKGSGSNEELRVRELLADFQPKIFPFEPSNKLLSALRLCIELIQERHGIVVMEGSGIGGGLPLIIGRLLLGTRYIVSSGDSVADFLSAKYPSGKALFLLYEFLLCRLATGFIGWTPYLAGRALAMGTPRVMSAPGWTNLRFEGDRTEVNIEVRKELGIPTEVVLAGIVGSLDWNSHHQYCYGLELIEAVSRNPNATFHVLVIGDGSGRKILEQRTNQAFRHRVHFTGSVHGEKLAKLLQALDVAILPQSTDRVGSYRYTTKISEYLAAGLPIILNQIPLGYDLPDDGFFRLPGRSPWDPIFWDSLAKFLGAADIRSHLERYRNAEFFSHLFNKARQRKSVHDFVKDIETDLLR